MISNKNLSAYVNGKYIPLDKASISILDLGFTNSEMIYDTFRTFNKVPYFVDEHIERLIFSSKYTGIKINLSIQKIKKIIKILFKKNLKFLKKNEDLWCFMRFTRSGSQIIEMRKINFANYAPYYKSGLRLHVPKLKRIPPEYLDPRFKNSSSYFTLSLAREEIWKFDRSANAILLDKNDNINEGYGFNIFFIKNKSVYTPKSKYVLPGVTRKKVIEISKKLKLKVIEKDISLKEVYTFNESFVTATGWGICSVKSLSKKIFKNQKYTKLIQQSFSKNVRIDIVNQYLSFLK